MSLMTSGNLLPIRQWIKKNPAYTPESLEHYRKRYGKECSLSEFKYAAMREQYSIRDMDVWRQHMNFEDLLNGELIGAYVVGSVDPYRERVFYDLVVNDIKIKKMVQSLF